MRLVALGMFALALASCNQNEDAILSQGNVPEYGGHGAQAEAAHLIRAGDPKGCAHDAVKRLIVASIMEKPEVTRFTEEDLAAVQDGLKVPDLSEIQVVHADAKTGQLDCQANVNEMWGAAYRTTPVQYTLRESLENDAEFILNADLREAQAIWKRQWADKAFAYARAHHPERYADQEPHPAPPIAIPITNLPESNQTDYDPNDETTAVNNSIG